MVGACEFCKREKELTKHHLIPKFVHGKRRFLRRFGKKAMTHQLANICQTCHNGVHDLFTEKELAESYFTVERLLADERMERHIAWARRQR